MLTSQKVIDAINEQIGYEFSAELQYYAIAAHFAAEALPQLSQHFFQQAEEEKGHALRFIKYVVDAGGRVVIPAIDAPKSKFKTARDAIKLSLDQEIHVTQQINGLVELARKQNDYITINFLQWFLTEQLEEVSSMDNLLKILERAGNDLLQADEYLARVGVRAIPTPPKESNFGGRRPPLQSEDGMSFKDHFSKQAADYAKFRPRYPHELFEYLGSVAPSRQLAWDCGTGNGQASFGLATAFDRVIATDGSEKQIANAQPHE